MKKKILLLFSFIFFLLFGIYFFRYKTSNSIKNQFPDDTKGIISINLRQIEHKILWDVIKNPSLYFFRKSDTKKNIDSIKYKNSKKNINFFSEVSFPKNIQLYSKNAELDEWYSTIINIKNPDNIIHYLKENGFIENKTMTHYKIFRKKSIVLILNSKELVLSIIPSNKSPSLKDLFIQNRLLDSNSKLIQNLNSAKSDVFFTTRKDFLNLNFLDGEIEINGTLDIDFLISQKNRFAPNSILSLSCNINKESDFIKQSIKQIDRKSFKKIALLDFDTIYKHWNGVTHFNLKKFTSTMDTITTYEYDDDFNQTEVTKTQKTTNPDFNLNFNTYKNLLPYFTRQNTISKVSNKTIFKQLPLIKTQIKASDSVLEFYTEADPKKLYTDTQSKLFLQFSAHSYREQTQGTIYYIPIITKIDYLNMAISKNNNVYGTLKMMDKSRNSLGQFIQ